MSILKTKDFWHSLRPSNTKCIGFILLAILSVGCKFLHAQTKPSAEYQVKAVFLFNFTQFVEWPAEAFAREDSPLVIGLLGEDPFGTFLEETVRGEKINKHPLVVQRFSKVEEAKTCHLLFVNITKPEQLKQVIENLKALHILTVSDVNNFTRLGGMVRIFTENNKTRIRINLDATQEADLTISSKLLKLAEIVPAQNN
jgi:hypothetical protein